MRQVLESTTPSLTFPELLTFRLPCLTMAPSMVIMELFIPWSTALDT